MPEAPLEGIAVRQVDDRVVIEVDGERWEGSAADAERLLSGLHYAIGRARPGVGIGSMFLNGALWGAKFVVSDPREAIEEMRFLVEKMQERLDALEADLPSDE